MLKDRPKGKSNTTLREEAEKRFTEKPARKVPPEDILKLVHELEVHQIELEMQNEELHRAQHAIEAANEKYTDFYDFAPVGYLTLDKKGVISDLNLTTARLLGVDRKVLVNTPFHHFIKPESQDIFYLHKQETLASSKEQTCDLVFKKGDGTFLYAQVDSIGVEVEGEPAMRVVLTDITDRKKEEEKLATSEKRLDQALRIADIGIWERNMQTGEVTWCDRMYRMFGEERATFVPTYKSFLSHVHIEDRQEFQDAIQDAIARRASYEIEFRIITGAADTRALLAHGEVILDLLGQPERITGTVLDLTARKKIEEDLRKAHDELELRIQERTFQLSQAYETLAAEGQEREKTEEALRQSQKMEAVGTLAGGIAHDFNNILAAIIGFAEMSLEDIPPESPLEKPLRYILTSSFRARDLVRQILAFSRKTGYERKPFSLTPIIKETAKLLRSSIPASTEIVVNMTILSDTVFANPTEIQQIIMNLGTNAAHAMRNMGGRLSITVSDADELPALMAEQDVAAAGYIQLTVTDTGVGMNAEVKKRIFEPFFTTKEVGEGTGMGLSVVYGIVKSLDGYITVESEPEMGSIFRIFLPKIEVDVPSEALKTKEIPKGKERILYVDDEELLAKWGEAALERLGYTVTAMIDSTEALKLFSEDPSRFDLVITDQAMPGIMGTQLSKKVLTIRPDIPIVLCTGHSDNISSESSREMGVREFLTKPVSKQELAEAVRRVLDGKDWRVK